MGASRRRTSTTTKLQVMSTGPSIILGLGRVATLASMRSMSKPEAEYSGRPLGGSGGSGFVGSRKLREGSV